MGEPALRDRIAASSGWQVSKQLGRGQYGTAYHVSWDEQKCGEEKASTKMESRRLKRAKTLLLTYWEPVEYAIAKGAVTMTALLATMVGLSMSYIYELDDDLDGDLNDKAGGWAQDLLLALTSLLFVLSSQVVVKDTFLIFYVGTAMAYGLGAIAHFLEDSTGAAGLTAYYVIMTLAFGGDALRSALGYGLKWSSLVKCQCIFAALIFGCLCASAFATLWKLLHGHPASEVRESHLGLAYKSTQIGMGFVEMSGSMVWYHSVRLELGPWSMIPAAMNVSAWLLVKFQPLFHAALGIKTTISHQLAHYMQAVAKVVGLEFLPEKEHNLAFQEVVLMRALRHPHIVALRDHFLTEASLELVIVMEFCNTGDLRGEVKRRTQVKPPDLIPEARLMAWFVQMTLALNYMWGSARSKWAGHAGTQSLSKRLACLSVAGAMSEASSLVGSVSVQSLHRASVLRIRQPGCSAASAGAAVLRSGVVLVLQGTLLQLLLQESCAPGCAVQDMCPRGTACMGGRCSACQDFGQNVERLLQHVGAPSGDFACTAKVDLVALRREEADLQQHACHIQAKCSSDVFEECDYVTYTLAAWRPAAQVAVALLGCLAWLPQLRSLQEAQLAEEVLEEEPEAGPFLLNLAAAYMKIVLRARAGLFWLLCGTCAVRLLNDPSPLGLWLLLPVMLAEALWPCQFERPNLTANLAKDSEPTAQLLLTGLGSYAVMLLLAFCFEDCMRWANPAVQFWGSGVGGLDCDMVLGTVEAFTTMAALAALLLATCYNLLAGLGRGCLRQACQKAVLSWVGVFWLLGLCHFLAAPGDLSASLAFGALWHRDRRPHPGQPD
ncbi:unnamed protein product [Effrenium voratum]|nr:unnamed protein product [Effrenium voratum]